MPQGRWGTIAQDRFGCWTVEKAFTAAELTKKSHIASELAQHERALAGSRFGQAVLSHCKIPHFKTDRKSWLDSFGE